MCSYEAIVGRSSVAMDMPCGDWNRDLAMAADPTVTEKEREVRYDDVHFIAYQYFCHSLYGTSLM
jgi:hypothetical protein